MARRWVTNRFFKIVALNNIKRSSNVYANVRVFDHSVFSFFFQSIPLSFLCFFIVFFLLQNACDKSSQCQNNATCQSGFTLKGYRCLCPPGFEGELCEKGTSLSQYLKWRIWDFFWFPMLVWQLFFSCWKRREFVLFYIVLNLSKSKFLIIVYWALLLFFFCFDTVENQVLIFVT